MSKKIKRSSSRRLYIYIYGICDFWTTLSSGIFKTVGDRKMIYCYNIIIYSTARIPNFVAICYSSIRKFANRRKYDDDDDNNNNNK